LPKYHKNDTKNQTQQGNENITNFKFNTIENITQKQRKIKLAKIKRIIMKSEGITP